MNLAPGWVLFSYILLRKEPRFIPRKSPESIGSIYSIPIDQLHPHPDNPFGIRDDPSMLELIESVKKHGVLVPAIARPKPDGGYELVAGHRRQRASQLSEPIYELIRQAETNGLLRVFHHEEIVEGCSEPDSPRRRKHKHK